MEIEPHSSEVLNKADFSKVRYAQCWEDTEVLIESMDVKEGDTCLSIASAGDNTLAILIKNPARVIAIDLSVAQLSCLELRIAAFQELSYEELLTLLGCTIPIELKEAEQTKSRIALYSKCRNKLSPQSQAFWDQNQAGMAMGIAHFGKFEKYFDLFRTLVLPMVHNKSDARQLLAGGNIEVRKKFFMDKWNTWQWRMLFRIFFSRPVMGRLGRDPHFFDYVEESTSSFLLGSTEYALTELDPAENPYLHWILTGCYGKVLPLYLKPQYFQTIKQNAERIELRHQSLEDCLDSLPANSVNAFNLSDVFEYMSSTHYQKFLAKIIQVGTSDAHLVYWNMMTPRTRPAKFATNLLEMSELSQELYRKNKAFFYRRLVIEKICK